MGMSSVRQSPDPQSARAYEQSEPGYALAGYLYHCEMAISTCMQAVDFSDRPTVPADHRRDVLLLDFSNCKQRLAPVIEKWHAELIESAKRIELLPEVAPLLDRSASTLESLWNAATEVRLVGGRKLSDRQAYEVATGKRKPPPPSQLDVSSIRPRIIAVVEVVERLRRLWPHFDPAHERVEAAIVPWERFYELAVAVNDGASDMIYKHAADSPGRIAASQKLSSMVEGELTLQWRLAVENALADDMAARIDSACKAVRDRARDCLAFSIRTSQYGDRAWPETWKKLNDAVLAFQDLRALQRRAVEKARLEARESRQSPTSLKGQQEPPPEPHILDEHIAVMKILAEAGRAVYRGDIRDANPAYGRDALYKAIDDLHLWEFVHGPPGSTKGVSLRAKGRQWLEEDRKSAFRPAKPAS